MASSGYPTIDLGSVTRMEPTDNQMFRRRVTLLKYIITELEEENNLVAYKIAKTRRRIESKRAALEAAAAVAAAAEAARNKAKSKGKNRGKGREEGRRSFWEKAEVSPMPGSGSRLGSSVGIGTPTGIDLVTSRPHTPSHALPTDQSITPAHPHSHSHSRSNSRKYHPAPPPTSTSEYNTGSTQQRNDHLIDNAGPPVQVATPPQEASSDNGMQVDEDIDDY